VRCGRCGSAFDALARLSDTVTASPREEPPVPLMEDGAAVAATAGTPEPAEYHFSVDDIEKVFIDAREWQRRFGPDSPPEPAAAASAAPAVVVQEDEPIEDITLEGERISIEASPGHALMVDSASEAEVTGESPVFQPAYEAQTVEPAAAGEPAVAEPPRSTDPVAADVPPEDELESEYATPSPREVAAALAAEWEATASRPALQRPAAAVSVPFEDRAEATPPAPDAAVTTLAAQRWRREAAEAEAELPLHEPRRPMSPRRRALLAATVVLGLTLVAQVAYRFRQDLARHPQFGSTARAMYAGLGIGVPPTWDLAAFEVRQWGNTSSPTPQGGMTVRASLTNRAAFPQPHPILRLELDDRYGSAIAVRDFEPAEYLKNRSDASRLIDSGATTEAELLIADPGAEAVGYRLDVCLRESAKLLRCAQGAG
jgi:hypothetical protein